MGRVGSFFKDLRRRRVFRVTALYIIGAWVVLQAADLAFPGLGIPDAAIGYVWIAAILGFPVALVFGWRFDIAGSRIIRTPDSDALGPDLSLHRTDYVILGSLAIVGSIIIFGLVAELNEAREPVFTLAGPNAIDPRSIAVLPFADQSADEENAAFLAFGIHDDLLTLLSRLGDIKVISRTSVEHYKKTDKTLKQIGRELGVAKILEGSVQRAGDRVRINVQLIDTDSDHHVWAQRFDRQINAPNIFNIQSEIAEAIATALKATLSPDEQASLGIVPTHSFEAYQAYLLGKQRYARRSSDGLAAAAVHFQNAISIDPEFALAYVGLADTFLLQVVYHGLNRRELFIQAEKAINTALSLNPRLGEAYTSLGFVLHLQGKFADAEDAYKTALRTNPNYAMTYHWYGTMLAGRGRSDEATVLFKQSIRLDPLAYRARVSLAIAINDLGKPETAIDQLGSVLMMFPDNPFTAQWWSGVINAAAFGRMDKAIAWEQQSYSLVNSRKNAWMGFYYLNLGDLITAANYIEKAVVIATEFETTHHAIDATAFGAAEMLAYYTGDENKTLDFARKVLASEQEHTLDELARRLALAHLRDFDLRHGQVQGAKERYLKAFPEFSEEPPPTLHYKNYWAAADLALVFQKAGEAQKAEQLLSLCLEFHRTRPSRHWSTESFGLFGLFDVQVLALQGRKTEALAALREAIDGGWRIMWWYSLEHDPNLDSIRGEPEFKTILAEVRADMAKQLARVREMEASGDWESIIRHKDKLGLHD